MRKRTYLATALIIGLLLLPAATFAHTFRSDGPVTVLLHVDPNDTPLTHEPAKLNFYVFDANNQFLGAQCSCSVKVTLGNKTILSQPVTFQDNGLNHVAQVPVVFPALGVYQILVVGKPKGNYLFHAFNLNYIQRVTTVGYASASSQAGTLELLATGGVIVAGLMVTVWLSRPKRRASTSPQSAKRRQE